MSGYSPAPDASRRTQFLTRRLPLVLHLLLRDEEGLIFGETNEECSVLAECGVSALADGGENLAHSGVHLGRVRRAARFELLNGDFGRVLVLA